MVDGQKIVFSGEGDQEPNLEPGDLIIVLDEKEHGVSEKHFFTLNNYLLNSILNMCLSNSIQIQNSQIRNLQTNAQN